jgi:cell division protein FtsA
LEYEAILVALDVGTSKVVVLVGEVTNDGALDIIGKGTMPTTGVKKGLVNNIDQTVSSIHGAIEGAERLSGLRLEAAFVGVGGDHLESLNSRGTVAVSGAHREITREDIERATEVARAVTIPSNREVLHVLPRDFTVDGQEGVKDPEGMSAIRLEVTTHIVHGGATALQNLTKCVRQAGVRPDELVVAAIASGEAVLTETERELGVAVADIGAGTTDLALYAEGSPFHTSVIPLGGVNVTNDIAIGLRTNLTAAEQLKMQFGSKDAKGTPDDAEAPVEVIDDGVSRPARKSDVTEIIDARMRELFEKIGEEISENATAHRLPAGLVLTGGAARLANAADLARDVLDVPVRVAAPEGVGGLTDNLLEPQFATAIGLLEWAARVVTTEDLQRYEPPPRTQNWDRLRDAFRRFFP